MAERLLIWNDTEKARAMSQKLGAVCAQAGPWQGFWLLALGVELALRNPEWAQAVHGGQPNEGIDFWVKEIGRAFDIVGAPTK